MGIETIALAVSAAGAIVGGASAQDQARRANKERENAKKAVKAREAELAAEAAAKEVARKKAESAGQRAGFGAGAGAGAVPTRASFVSSAQAGTTGMGNAPSEDNISRGTLFGN